MSTNSIQIEYNDQADFTRITSASISKIAVICNQVTEFLIRREPKKARGDYLGKQRHDIRNQVTPDAFQGLSLEQKMRHGLYRYMD